MGPNLNWLAVEAGDKTRLLERLGFRESGWASDEVNSEYACAVLPSGWVVIVSAETSLDLVELLPVASAESLALGCEVSETVMFSRLQAYRQGSPVWAVTHDPEKGTDSLDVEGEPPAALAEIQARLAGERAAGPREQGDFMFEAPASLAATLCGYLAGTAPVREWLVLRPAGETPLYPQARSSGMLSTAIRSEFLPLMQSLGWQTGAGPSDELGGPRDLVRIVDGHRQVLWCDWKDAEGDRYFLPSFIVWHGTEGHRPLVSGNVRPLVAPPLWRRIIGFMQGTKRPSPDERMAELVARAKQDLLDIDRFLKEGVINPSINIKRGSAEALQAANDG